MVRLERLAEAALNGEALLLRSLTQDWLIENPVISDSPAPLSEDPQVLVVAAALVELFAERMRQAAPSWSGRIGSLAEPHYLLRAARTMKHLRKLCETESPVPLRRRNLYAPGDFLQFV